MGNEKKNQTTDSRDTVDVVVIHDCPLGYKKCDNDCLIFDCPISPLTDLQPGQARISESGTVAVCPFCDSFFINMEPECPSCGAWVDEDAV